MEHADKLTKKEYNRLYFQKMYSENAEKILSKHRGWYHRNKVRVHARQKLWRDSNKLKCLEYKRKWKSKNMDQVRASARRLYASKSPELRRECNRPGNIRRKARLRSAKVVNCTAKIRELSRSTECYWCTEKLTDFNRTIDHVTPLFRGGFHAPDNLVACCKQCNSSKGRKLYWEWDGELAA